MSGIIIFSFSVLSCRHTQTSMPMQRVWLNSTRLVRFKSSFSGHVEMILRRLRLLSLQLWSSVKLCPTQVWIGFLQEEFRQLNPPTVHSQGWLWAFKEHRHELSPFRVCGRFLHQVCTSNNCIPVTRQNSLGIPWQDFLPDWFPIGRRLFTNNLEARLLNLQLNSPLLQPSQN